MLSITNYKFILFSTGSRTCHGYSMAKVTFFLQAATLVHCFEFYAKEELDLTENWGLTIMPIRHGDDGKVFAKTRPAARLCSKQPGDK